MPTFGAYTGESILPLSLSARPELEAGLPILGATLELSRCLLVVWCAGPYLVGPCAACGPSWPAGAGNDGPAIECLR